MKKNFILAAGAMALLASCSPKQNGMLSMGSKSEFDSISYAVGVNMASSFKNQLKDIPMNIDKVAEGIEAGAFSVSAEDAQAASEYIRNFMMKDRMVRKQMILTERKKADSVRMAEGDSTQMIYPEPDPKMFEDDKERDDFSRKFGINLASSMVNGSAELQVVWVQEALKNVWNDEAKMTNEEAGNYMRYFWMEKLPKMNAERASEWMEEKASKSGAVKMESGVVYKIENEGDMSLVAKGMRDTLKMHFTGRSMKGRVFGATHFADLEKATQEMIKQYNPDAYGKDEPISVTREMIFPGWAEVMPMIGKGGKATLWLPASAAFGPFGNRREVGPNEAIEIEFEVLDVVPFVLDPASPEAVNKRESEAWLAEIEKQDGVEKTESGLLYRIDRKGGEKATKDTDRVKVNYEGRLRTGEVFDSSYERKEPIIFGLNQVIKGWTEGMKLVGKGGKITLWIPSDLAYGERGAGENIGANEALEFTVELLDINPTEK